MSRFGVKTLLYYHIYPKQSNYILINSTFYYHPYRREYTKRAIYTITYIANVVYESERMYECRKITVKINHNIIQYYASNQGMYIGIWVGKRYYIIQPNQYGFIMSPTVDELTTYVNWLKPVSIYDLYFQSIVWLLEFVAK